MASMVFHLAFNLRTITTVVRDEPNTENQPKYEKKKKKKKKKKLSSQPQVRPSHFPSILETVNYGETNPPTRNSIITQKALIFRMKLTPCTNFHFFFHHRTRTTTEMKQHNQNTKKT